MNPQDLRTHYLKNGISSFREVIKEIELRVDYPQLSRKFQVTCTYTPISFAGFKELEPWQQKVTAHIAGCKDGEGAVSQGI